MKKLTAIIATILLSPSLCSAKLVWEVIDIEKSGTNTDTVYRASIPQGWLVRYRVSSSLDMNRLISGSITFVPDEHHEWSPER